MGLFRRNPIKRLEKSIDNILKDMDNPKGQLAKTLESSVANTADYFADRVNSIGGFKSKTGAIIQGLRQSYTIHYPYSITLVDEDKMDNFVNSRNPMKHSRYNPNKYPSYWQLIWKGWGKRGGDTTAEPEGYPLALWVKNNDSGETFITSPFNPNSNSYFIVGIFRHPGREGRDWFEILETDYNKFLKDDFESKFAIYLKQMGLY